MDSPDLKRWEVTAPPQPATKEHQTYTTAAFRFHDITLATTSIFEETTAADDFGFVRCSMYFTSNRQISAGPWEAIGSKGGGDDLIPLGPKGSWDYGKFETPRRFFWARECLGSLLSMWRLNESVLRAGLCYSAPPLTPAGSDESRIYYWGVNGEHCETDMLSRVVARLQSR